MRLQNMYHVEHRAHRPEKTGAWGLGAHVRHIKGYLQSMQLQLSTWLGLRRCIRVCETLRRQWEDSGVDWGDVDINGVFMDLARSWVWPLMLKSEATVKISEEQTWLWYENWITRVWSRKKARYNHLYTHLSLSCLKLHLTRWVRIIKKMLNL